jgi:hypothetical protein
MAKRRRKEPKICSYCGIPTSDWTWDEPVPKCVFAPPRDNLVKVPACKTCNNEGKSLDDSFLRDILALNKSILMHPDGSFILDSYLRSAKKGTSVVDRIVRKYGEIARDAKTGLYLPNRISVAFNRDRITRIFKWMARGLYFHEHGQILADDYRYGCARISRTEAEKKEKVIADLGFEPRWSVGSRGQFRYFHIWFEDWNVTFWQMVFYETEFFLVGSTPPGVNSLEEFDRRLRHRQESTAPSGEVALYSLRRIVG